MTQSSCKRDTKSKSHPGMKLAPVRVFSCKHLLRNVTIFIIVVDSCIIIIHEVVTCNSTLTKQSQSDDLILKVISHCFLQEKSLCLGTSYKTKDVFIRSSYYYYCKNPVCMICKITQFARASVGLCPFPRLDVREFVLSHRNLVSRIIKITHAYNLDVKMLDFGPFTIRT